MRVVCGLPGPPGAWERAAAFLGHRLVAPDPARPLDALRRERPDAVLLDGPALACPGVARWVNRFAGRLAVRGEPGGFLLRTVDLWVADRPVPWVGGGLHVLAPAADVLPTDPPPRVRPELACACAWEGPYGPDLDPYLGALVDAGLDLKAFGTGPYPLPQYLGRLAPAARPDLFRSAGVVLDLRGDPARRAAVWAAGGTVVTATGSPADLVAAVRTPPPAPPGPVPTYLGHLRALLSV